MNRKFLAIAMGIVVVAVIAGISYTYVQSKFPAFHGSVITPPLPLQDFSLTRQDSTTVHLTDYRGKYVLVYFGFTNCTEECPLTMGFLKQMYDKLGTEASQVMVVMITTDPNRDTPAILGEFLDHFSSKFVGLTGSSTDLQAVWKEFGVTVLPNVDTHSSFVYLIDTQGNLIATYPSLQNATDITADMKSILKVK